MKNLNINPVGLKGKEINDRIIQLMGKTAIQEEHSRSVVELTKIGPDGKAYGIVRENHEYYIKVTDKTSKLINEDFKYIGGLQNKKAESYPSYAKAIKQLNLTFKSLAEAYGKGGDINIFVNDKLMKEGAFGDIGGGGAGFSGAGNLEGNSALYEEEELDECGDDMMMEEDDVLEEIEMSDDEIAIDEMIAEESHGYDDQYPMRHYGGYDNDGNKIPEKKPVQAVAPEKKSLIQKAKEKLGFKEGINEDDVLEEEISDEEKEAILKKGNPEKIDPIVEKKVVKEDKKYVLKLAGSKPAPAPAAPVAEPADDAGFDDLGGGEMPPAPDAPADDKPFDDAPFDAGVEADEATDPKKYIEQLTGKLGQSLRDFTEQQGSPDFELEKFSINSLLSATHTAEMDEQDKNDIIKKVNTSGDDGNEEGSDNSGDSDNQDDFGDSNGGDNEMGDDGGMGDDFGGGEDEELDEIEIFENKTQAEIDNPLLYPDGWKEIDMIMWDIAKKNNMFQDGSNDKLKNSLGNYLDENLLKSEKNRIFDKNHVLNKLHESLNQDNMQNSEPYVEPAPTIKPTRTPVEKPVAPSRRNKPFLPMPEVDVPPKAMKEDSSNSWGHVVRALDDETLNMQDLPSIAATIQAIDRRIPEETAMELAQQYVQLVIDRDAKSPSGLGEAKRAPEHETYYKTFSEAVQTARQMAENKGFEISDDDWWREVAMGPRKPQNGQTNRYSIPLYLNGKEQKKALNIQVYGMENNYELNAYIS